MIAPSDWQLPTRQASLFGKLPTKLDYVRIQHSFSAAIAFDTWAQRGLQELTMAGLTWPQDRFRFLFAPPECAHALVGVMAPSRDQAGRKFPVTIFAPLPQVALSPGLGALPFACQPFLDGAEALIAALDSLTFDDVNAQLATLAMPQATQWEQGQGALAEALESRTTESFTQSLFEPAPDTASVPAGEAAAFAFHTLLTATAAARGGPSGRATLLDCPVRQAGDVAAWLTLAERTLGWTHQAPSCFWKLDADASRCVLSLGLPPVSVPQWLAAPARRNDRLWSLRCEQAELGRRAYAELRPTLEKAPTTGAMVQLVRVLAERGQP